MDTKKKIIIFGAFAITIVFIFIILFPKKSQKKNTSFKQQIKLKDTQKRTSDPVLAKKIFLKRIQEYKKRREEIVRRKEAMNLVEKHNQSELLKKQKSDTVKKRFLKEIYLKADLPEELTYSEVEIDLDEPIKIIRGDTPSRDSRLLIGATTIVLQQPEEILAFIKENESVFPDLNQNLISEMKLTIQKKNPQPGFKQMNVWEAHSEHESEVLVYLLRSDNRGSYVFSYSGEFYSIQNNDHFEDLLRSLKPQSAPANIYK